MNADPIARQTALRNFEQARRRAWGTQLLARWAGRDAHLLPFEKIRAQLKTKNPMYQGVRLVPLAQIVGSVGRYKEFTREFLPLHDSFRERWVNMDALAAGEGWLPIELYQISDVFFVKDGNHRVSVARQMGLDSIEAHVWSFPSEVEIGPEDNLDQLLIRFGEQRFLEQTGLAKIHPEHRICFTTPGRYTELLAQIEDLVETLAQIDGQRMSYEEAVGAWYDLLYLPTIQIIYEAGLLEKFPGRTEGDLFVWLSLFREQLGERYGAYNNLEEMARALAAEHGEGGLGRLTRQVRRLLGQDSLPPLEIPGETALEGE